MSKEVLILDIQKVRFDGGTRCRCDVSEDVVAEYMECVNQLPPVKACFDGTDYWLWDGFYGYFARKDAGHTMIRVCVEPGSRRDAVLKGLGANASHGVRRTNADKRKAVLTMLKDDEWCDWADRQIAQICAVTHPFVGKLRAELADSAVTVTTRRTIPRGTTESPAKLTTQSTLRSESDPAVETTFQQVENILRDAVATATTQCPPDDLARLGRLVVALGEGLIGIASDEPNPPSTSPESGTV